MSKGPMILMFLMSVKLSADMGQALSGQINDDSWVHKSKDSQTPFVGGGKTLDLSFDDDVESANFVIGGEETGKEPIHFKNEGLGTQRQRLPSITENKQYLKADDEGRFQEISRNGTRGLRFYYIDDTYDYRSRDDNFNKIFKDKYLFKGKDRKGYFMIESDWYMTKKDLFHIFWGVNAGVGQSRAYGIFVDGKSVNKDIILWTIPVGIPFGLEIPLKWFKITALVGPSVLGVIQHRRDKVQGHRAREKRQYGLGHFAEGRMSFNFGRLIKSKMVRLFSQYNITNIYLDFIARNQRYSRFKDEAFGVSGVSYGAGLTFEYL